MDTIPNLRLRREWISVLRRVPCSDPREAIGQTSPTVRLLAAKHDVAGGIDLLGRMITRRLMRML